MTNKKRREIALDLIQEQISNAPYSLEREEYESLPMEEIEAISIEMNKILQQFNRRYNLK